MNDCEVSQDAALQAITPTGTRTGDAGLISKIEEIFASLVDNLSRKETLSVAFTVRTRRQGPRSTGHKAPDIFGKRTFPGSSQQEALRFTRTLRILEFIHEALVNSTIITKREIYYRDPALFVQQATVDRCVDDLAFTFGVRRAALNVVAAVKGLVAGTFTITRHDGTTIDYASEPEGSLVPNVEDGANIDLTEIYWILVIEKEATFRSLAISKFYRNHNIGNGIILTAKGYPDISTRAFLHTLTASSPTPTPSFALVDYDPDGLSITSTYKRGSVALAHENDYLTCPRLHWLGLRSCDLNPVHDDEAGLLELTVRDRKKAAKMLEKEPLAEGGEEKEWRRELQVMLVMGFKAEIQLMSGRRGGLEEWLEGRLREELGR